MDDVACLQDLRVSDAIKDAGPFTARRDQAGVAHHIEVLGDIGIGHAQAVGKIADATLAVAQGIQQAQPFGVGQNLTQAWRS